MYANSFNNAWSFDDNFVVVGNSDIRSFENFIANTYPGRPLRELSMMLDYHVFGLFSTGWHLQNVLWHALNAWLVFVMSSLLFDDKKTAWLAAALFLVHPLQVEVVAQVSHRKDSLSLFFMLLSFISYLTFKRGGKRRLLFYSTVSMAIAILAKQNAIVFPLLVLIYEVFIAERVLGEKSFDKKIISVLLILAAVPSVPILINYNYIGKMNAVLQHHNYFYEFEIQKYLLIVINSWGHIFLKLIYPFNLSVNYILEVPFSFWDIRIVLTCIFITIYLSSLYFLFKINKYCFFSLLWIGLLFLPTSNIIPITHLAADRYLYAPSVGFFMIFSFLVTKNFDAKAVVVLVTPILFGLSFLTIQQNNIWQNSLTLWSHSMNVNPNSAVAISNVGILLYSDDPDKNLKMQLRANKINPYDSFVELAIGEIYEKRGELDLSRKHYKKSQDLFNAQGQNMYRGSSIDPNKKVSIINTSD
ncbi:hypothetical protein P9J64_04530 [Deltaproteobacteria bacterium IMCC39524]|nr:hypothetical protein [Deltaproteobacteria bacterium IMCC39524]